MSEYTILVAGHSFVVDTNREVWSELAAHPDKAVDILLPQQWTSNLIKNLTYHEHKSIDRHFQCVHALPVINSGNASFFFFHPLKLYQLLRDKKYHRILLAQETWSLSLFVISIIKWFTINRHTQIDLWVCQNIKKAHLSWMHPWERLNTCCVNSILHCCQEIQDVIIWKKISKQCRYFPFSFNPTKYQENYQHNTNRPQQQNTTLGHLGRLSEEKGIEQLLAAVEKLQQEDQSLIFRIAGGGPLEGQVQDFCHGHPRRHYLGLLPHNEAHLFYRDLDLFILTSQTRSFWKEQFGRVIIEAVASGCHFVGSSSGAIPEVMAKVHAPHTYQESDIDDLITKCNHAIKDIRSHTHYACEQEKRHQLAMQTFSHRAVAELYARYLDEDFQ